MNRESFTLALIAAVLVALGMATAAQAQVTLEGYVYEGATGDEPPTAKAIADVTVSLYGSNQKSNDGTGGAALETTTTNPDGSYALTVNDDVAFDYINIVQTNKSGYIDSEPPPAATSVGGDPCDSNWIQYSYQSLFVDDPPAEPTGNNFYDKLEPPDNHEPVAQHQSVITDEDVSIDITLTGTDADNDTLTYWRLVNPDKGTLSPDTPSIPIPPVITYTPDLNWNGVDSFTFSVHDGVEESAPATVSITVRPVNDEPEASEDTYQMKEGQTLTQPAPGVLFNDCDVDEDSLTVELVSGPSHGSLTLNQDGSFTYTPDPGFHDWDNFTYRASDGQSSDTAPVYIQVEAAEQFKRGDANADGVINIADPASTLDDLFRFPSNPACEDAADTNDDGVIDFTDARYLVQYMYLHKAQPPAPFPQCGADPTPDGLTSDNYPPSSCNPSPPQQDPDYQLDFVAPPTVSGPAGSQVQFTAQVASMPQNKFVQGWSFGLTLAGSTAGCEIVDVDTSQAISSSLSIEFDVYKTNPPDTAFGAVLTDFIPPYDGQCLDAASTVLAEVTISATVPASGSKTCTLNFADVPTGGAGAYVMQNVLAIDGEAVYPQRSSATVTILPEEAQWDFGDAPTQNELRSLRNSYPTLRKDNGARHKITDSGPWLGDAADKPDADEDGQPRETACGDDYADEYDEDGSGWDLNHGSGWMGITVSGGGGWVDAWIDFNGDGIWQHPQERILSGFFQDGRYELDYDVPVDSITGRTFARIRINSRDPLRPDGPADDGEVEDHLIHITPVDCGDAPDPPYPTLDKSNGPRLSIIPIIPGPGQNHLETGYLGTSVDCDQDGQPTSKADGDDKDGNDDDDGVEFTTVLLPGQQAIVRVSGRCIYYAKLYLWAWIDFNGDGDWQDPGEQIANESLEKSPLTFQKDLRFTVPANAQPGYTFARFILSDNPDVESPGYDAYGEIEDYRVFIGEQLDYGDAPHDGVSFFYPDAWHELGGPYVGMTRPDPETKTQAIPPGEGDDNNGDDEDEPYYVSAYAYAGSTFWVAALCTPSSTKSTSIGMWMDVDRNKTWDSAEELTWVLPSASGAVGVGGGFRIPADVVPGETYIRIRIAEQGSPLSPGGAGGPGEVEDHRVEIKPAGAAPPGGAPQGGLIWGFKWNDLNGNGVWETSGLSAEPPLSNYPIWLDKDGDGKPEEMTATDQSGWFAFPGLATGTYTVGEQARPSWTQTRPGGAGTYTEHITADPPSSFCAMFGNQADGGPGPEQHFDYGDAPHDGVSFFYPDARHKLGGPYLGTAATDAEAGMQPPQGLGDDNDAAGDDEDGVIIPPFDATDPSATAKVTHNVAGFLNAWIDFNGDGDWDDPGEQIFQDKPISGGAGTVSYTFQVPYYTKPCVTYGRFRVSTNSGVTASGTADDGEVEDHIVTIGPLAPGPGDPRQDYGDAPQSYPDFMEPVPSGPSSGAGKIGIREVIGNGIISDQDACINSLHSGGIIVDYAASTLNIDDSSGTGNFLNDDDFRVVSNNFIAHGAVQNLSLLARGAIYAPTDGDYTFCVGSDDGFTLQFPGHDFRSYSGDGEIAGLAGGAALRFCSDRAFADTLGVIHLPAGYHPFVLTYHEHEGSAAVEFSAATGAKTAFDSNFKLIGSPGGLQLVAPPQYPTLLDNNGAGHLIKPQFYLGTSIDDESNGRPSSDASGDDYHGTDDEDGVELKTPLIRGTTAKLEVTASAPGYVDAWIDFDADGNWNQSGDRILTGKLVAAGSTPLSVAIPASARIDAVTYARFRFSMQGELAPDGPASDGEVEDYTILLGQRGPYPPTTGPVYQFKGPAEIKEPAGEPFSQDYYVTLTNPEPVQGWVVAAGSTYQPLAWSADVAGTRAADSKFAEFEVTYDYPEGVTSGVVLDLNPPYDGQALEPNPSNQPHRLLHITIQGTMPNASQQIKLDFPDNKFGNPLLSNIVVVGGMSQNPRLIPKTITLVPSEPGNNLDYGDAPTSAQSGLPNSYPSASHELGGPYWGMPGQTPDADPGMQHDAQARGDDNDADGHDEKGVHEVYLYQGPQQSYVSLYFQNHSSTSGLTAAAWLDMNADGIWEHPGELIDTLTTPMVTSGPITLVVWHPSLTLPATAKPGPTYLRIRIYEGQGVSVSPSGPGAAGEVEDHLVQIKPAGSPPPPGGVPSSGGRISGFKWNDLNDNGVWETTGAFPEPAVANYAIWLDKDGDGRPDDTTTTNRNGKFEFTDLSPGTYTVGEQARPGWRQTCPAGAGTYTIEVDANPQVSCAVQFGNHAGGPTYDGTIRGVKYNDENGNGTWDTEEEPLADWMIYLDLNQSGQWDAGEPLQFTDTDGMFEFAQLAPGDYTVAEQMEPGWTQTWPGGAGTHTVTLEPLVQPMSVQFGNRADGGSAEAEHVKWAQPPVEIEHQPDLDVPPLFCGWDEQAVSIQGLQTQREWAMVADNFRCLGPIPITGIRWWGSFNGWDEPELPPIVPQTFHIGIWANVPQGPAEPFSRPGKLLWQNYCNDWTCQFAGYDQDPRIPASAGDGPGLVAHWQLDGDATDSVGTNDGTVYGDPVWVTTGMVDGALSLDGSGDYVNCGDNPALNLADQITVAAWVNITSVPGDWRAIIAKGDSAWRLSTVWDQRKLHFGIGGAPDYPGVDGVTDVPLGQWHHVAGTYDGATIRLYVDGVLDATTAHTGGIGTNAQPVYIGENAERVERWWHGLIDDIRVYDRALSREEISGLMAPPQQTNEACFEFEQDLPQQQWFHQEPEDLVGHWMLDETEGDIAYDSASANDGIVYGDPIWTSGKVGGALALDGNGDYVDCGDAAVFDIADRITVAAWVNIAAVHPNWKNIIAKGDSAWRLSTLPGQKKFHFAVGGPPDYPDADGIQDVTTGQWHHVAGTYDGATIRLYVDGVPDATTAYTGGIGMNAQPVFIGENAERVERWWHGLIDDVRIYDRALSEHEIEALYTGGDQSIYWLSITGMYPEGVDPAHVWGWKTRPEGWMASAVRFAMQGEAPSPPVDPTVIGPIEHQVCGSEMQSFDMSFELLTQDPWVKWDLPFTGLRDWPHYEDEISVAAEDQQDQLLISRRVADDWHCQGRDPVVAVAWQGSYVGYGYEACTCAEPMPAEPRRPDYFLLNVWADAPADAQVLFDHPGDKVWEYKAYEYNEVLVGFDKHPEGQPNEPVFRYSVRLPKGNWFQQDDVNRRYWFSVVAVYKEPVDDVVYPWGWTNHQHISGGSATAESLGSEADGWEQLHNQVDEPIDMSFILFTSHDDAVDAQLTAAFAFGARLLDCPTYNEPAVNYTMVYHGSPAELQYDPARGWGYEVLYPTDSPYGDRSGYGMFGPFDDSPNERNAFGDDCPEELYDSFIGSKDFINECSEATVGEPDAPCAPAISPEGIVFRVDVPNGLYRFVGAFGDAENVHAHRMLAEDGGSGPPENIGPNHVVLVSNFDQAQQTIGESDPLEPGKGVYARVGFDGKIPPPGNGVFPSPQFVDMDENGLETSGVANSPILQVTQGYIRIHQLQGNSNDGPGGLRDANGGDIVILELWKVADVQ